RDRIFGDEFTRQVWDLGIREVLSAPRSPWQRAYVERVIGSIRRECVDHMIVFGETSLRRTLRCYFDYYHRSRTHLALGKDAPDRRPVQRPELGPIVAIPQVGGLHHRYERLAACKVNARIVSDPLRGAPGSCSGSTTGFAAASRPLGLSKAFLFDEFSPPPPASKG